MHLDIQRIVSEWLTPCALAGLFIVTPVGAQPHSREVLAQVAKVTAANAMPNDWLGYSVSISGNRIAAGMPLEGETGGSVRLFERQSDGRWFEVDRIIGDDTLPFDNFGLEVALDGDVLAVGVEDRDDVASGAGAAYVFERQASGAWEQAAKLLLPDAATLDHFGSTVTLDGHRLAVTAAGDDDTGAQSGSVTLFERDAFGQWNRTDKLTASDGEEFLSFGSTLALDGDLLAVGSSRDSDTAENVGAVYVFERNPDATWTETAQITSPDGAELDRFGIGLALDGDRMAIGAYWNDEAERDAGAVYLYERQPDGTWTGIQKLLASDPGEFFAFGNAVTLENDQLVAGSPDTDALDNGAGGLYFFQRNAQGRFIEETRAYPADDNPVTDRVGQQLALDQGILAVGNWRDDDAGSSAGAVFIFEPVTVEPSIRLTGSCPGEVTISVSGVTPYDQARLYAASAQGSAVLDAGRCQGVELGLAEARLVFRTRTEFGQDFEIVETFGAQRCGTYVQILDRRTCLTSNVVQLPGG